MNQFDNNPNFIGIPPQSPMINPLINNNLTYKINELENKIKKLEQRIIRLENNKLNQFNYQEPDNSLYMI